MNVSTTIVERVTITGPIEEVKQAYDFIRREGYRLVIHEADPANFTLIAERERKER